MNTAVLQEDLHATEQPRASRLQSDLAGRILRMLKEQGAGPGHHLVELDLCRLFDVSRTPVRGALKLLAEQGAVEQRANRGYVLRGPIIEAPEVEVINPANEEDQRLFITIAEARNAGRLPDQCSQQEIVRILGAKLGPVVRVLRQLADLGLVERKPGNGWSFALPINSGQAREDSYSFRSIVEPAGLIEPTFELDLEWYERSRARHIAFRKRKWRDTLAVELFEINSDFHEQLARCSGNRYVLDAVQRQNRLRSFLNIQWVNGVERVLDSIDEHVQIMDALANGDNRRAYDLMKAHLTSARDVEPTIS
ncbi:GntR family transcriptional regulator [Sphingomonas sp. JC676]|uniref:GntR family transcriptional regulator n=1 Tax=Sphingomonas sp. JC676 TaxID=2768065 RepID=UPI00165842BC|nr:GntR family transcriptional regulator [Sphingomonas sp. JC676]MBC9033749.1 GntR family transcriptional regulator [Sphingomonas sp. JC676]